MANNWEEASELLASQSPVKDETSDPAHQAQLNNWVEYEFLKKTIPPVFSLNKEMIKFTANLLVIYSK